MSTKETERDLAVLIGQREGLEFSISRIEVLNSYLPFQEGGPFDDLLDELKEEVLAIELEIKALAK